LQLSRRCGAYGSCLAGCRYGRIALDEVVLPKLQLQHGCIDSYARRDDHMTPLHIIIAQL
jgi:hypothetical protein